MELSQRLGAMAAWLEKSERVTDIGTDHGLLPIYLAERGFTGLIAADLRKQPLDKARENAAKHGVSGIDFRISDGLEKILPGEADAVIIAGLSGETIISIMEKAPWLKGKKLILQPMSRPWLLRMFLSSSGYALEAERQIFEEGRFFVVMLVRGGEKRLTPAQTYGGLDPSPEYLRHLIAVNERAAAGMSVAEGAGDDVRFAETKNVLSVLREALENAQRK